jgi:hypothetical protein
LIPIATDRQREPSKGKDWFGVSTANVDDLFEAGPAGRIDRLHVHDAFLGQATLRSSAV